MSKRGGGGNDEPQYLADQTPDTVIELILRIDYQNGGGLPRSHEYQPLATVRLKKPRTASSPVVRLTHHWPAPCIFLITLYTRNMEEELHQIAPDSDLPPAAHGFKPSHPDLVKVKFAPGSYASWLIAVKVCPLSSQWVSRLLLPFRPSNVMRPFASSVMRP
jgi:hypothetical protein